MRKISLLFPLILIAACGPVRSSFVRPDYETVDKTQTVRLLAVVASTDTGALPKALGEIARKYANDKRDFIVMASVIEPGEPDAAKPCDAALLHHPPEEGATQLKPEGVLWLTPKLTVEGAGVSAEVRAKILRCKDGETIWSAEAGGSWASDDPTLVAVREHYVQKFGAEVSPYVAPAFHLVKATLDTLPMPKLDEAGVSEKIDLDE